MSANSEAGNIMYRFLECTAGQYMTPSVVTVTRRVTIRELEALFEKKVARVCDEIRFPSGVRFHHWSDAAPLQ
jgi:hypothetical protein